MILLDIPALGKKTTVAASYSKFVRREMSKAEALLKVILSPVDSVGNTYHALLPEGTPLEFQQILALKGLKKADQQAITEDFSKHSLGIRHQTPSVAPAIVVQSAPPIPPTASTVITTSSTASNVGAGGAGAGAITMSREDTLTRACCSWSWSCNDRFQEIPCLNRGCQRLKRWTIPQAL